MKYFRRKTPGKTSYSTLKREQKEEEETEVVRDLHEQGGRIKKVRETRLENIAFVKLLPTTPELVPPSCLLFLFMMKIREQIDRQEKRGKRRAVCYLTG